MAGDIVFEMVLDDRGMVAGVRRADVALRDFGRTAQQTSRVVKESEDKYESLGHKFRSMVITFGALRFALMDVQDVFVKLPLSILNTSGELEKMRVLMKGISNEASELAREAEGTKDFNYVINFAKSAPFDVKSLSDSFVKLKTAGIDPATGAMDALVNSVAKFGGDGEVLKRASIAIQQMAGKGVISMEELRQQLGEAIPTAMRDMADGLGMTMAELAKAVKTGTLQAGPALQAMFIQMRINSLGAAQEFMETWSGATSQLKTEWALTTELIAKSGFAESSKDAVAELVQMLRSPEFREFGMAFGSGLANAVEVLKGLVSGIIKYRDEIGFLIQGMVALKAIDIFGSLGKGATEAVRSMNAARVSSLANLEKVVVANRRASYEQHENLQKELIDEKRALAEKLALQKQELAATIAHNNKLVADAIRVQGILDNKNFKGGVPVGPGQIVSRADAATLVTQKKAENAILEQSQARLTGEIHKTNEAIKQSGKSFQSSVVQQRAYVAQSALAALGTKALTVATTGLSAAMSFMGGPIGLLITGLGALSFWYMKVANDAEQSAIRQKNAKKGISSEEDLKKVKEELKGAEELLAEKQRVAELRAKNPQSRMYFANADGLKEQEKKVAELRATLANSEIANKDMLAKDAADADTFRFAQEERAIAAASKEKGRLLTVATQKEVQAAGDNKKLQDAARNKLAAENRALLSENDTKILEAAESFQRKAAAQLGAANIPAGLTTEGYKKLSQEQQNALAIATAADERVEQLREKLKATESKTGADFGRGVNNPSDNEVKAAARKAAAELNRSLAEANKPIKTERESEAQAFLVKVNADKEAVEEALGQLNSLEPLVDKGKIQADRIRELFNLDNDPKYKAKAYTGKDKKAIAKFDKDQKALNEAREKDRVEMEKAITQNSKNVEDKSKVGIRTKIIDQARETNVELEDAIRALESSTGQGMGAKELEFKKFFAALQNGGKDVEMVAEQFEALKASKDNMEKTAKAIDAAGPIAEMRENLKRLSADETGLTQEAIRTNRLAREEDYRKKMQQSIDNLNGIAGNEKQVASAREALDNEMALRNKQIMEETRTPVEKLAAQWKDTATSMKEATADWAGSTMDSITELVTTGKADFASLATSIIKDLAKIAIQKAMGGAVSGAMSWAGSAISSAFFADGGVMSSMGSLPLEKYAMGGVANSPQVAIFGEGRMNEAYVPLPDGRTIPVTMTGGGGGSSVVNIAINISQGQETESSSGSDASMWKGVAGRVRGVVLDELVRQKRPGGALYT